MRTYPIGQNSPDKRTWWKVDLGGLYSIHSINIQFKSTKVMVKEYQFYDNYWENSSLTLLFCQCVTVFPFPHFFNFSLLTMKLTIMQLTSCMYM